MTVLEFGHRRCHHDDVTFLYNVCFSFLNHQPMFAMLSIVLFRIYKFRDEEFV